NRELTKNNVPAFATLGIDLPVTKHDRAPNLSLAIDGFFNPPHLNTEDISDFTFAVFVPISKKDGQRAGPLEDYEAEDGCLVSRTTNVV
ncbi:hypothetical protein PSTG_15645, partial [Puccinia striiformis f. sp. tritici PST-78]